MIVAVDTGFGETKAVNSHGKEMKFRSEFSIYDDRFVLPGVNGKVKIIEHDGKKFVVGQEVEKTGGTAVTMSDVDSLIEYSPVFLQNVKARIGMSEDDTVAVGLPLGAMDRRDELKRRLKKVFPNNIIVCAQGMGIYLDAEVQDAVVIDVGQNTVDIFVGEKGKIVREESDFYLNAGISQIVNKLHRYIQTKYELNLSIPELQQALRTKKQPAMGQTVDLKDIISDLSADYSTALLQRITTQYAQRLRKVERIIVAGGGAYYLNVKGNKFSGLVMVPEKPEFANARGFVKIAKKLTGGN